MAAVSAALRPPAAGFIGRSMAAAPRWPFFRPLASASSASTAGGGRQHRQLVLYTKKGCCLCDGLKEKLEVAFLIGGPHSLSDVQLQVRDIADNPDWERLYQYEIPVLAQVLPDGSELLDDHFELHSRRLDPLQARTEEL
ncbi:hypothetical protein Taro_025258 [Colocasia esculenta]|uniref:Glutaredoxin-like protein n=1 Tax=Colocasia esculenta TaxID=4460 RepID=A0A843V9Q2_COLES|nr:hypothetical protein [Colocasia esculenta]